LKGKQKTSTVDNKTSRSKITLTQARRCQQVATLNAVPTVTLTAAYLFTNLLLQLA